MRFENGGGELKCTFVIDAAVFIHVGHFDEFVETRLRDGFVNHFHCEPKFFLRSVSNGLALKKWKANEIFDAHEIYFGDESVLVSVENTEGCDQVEAGLFVETFGRSGRPEGLDFFDPLEELGFVHQGASYMEKRCSKHI